MRALKINFGGPNNVSIDWNSEVTGLSGVAQRGGVAVMTHTGSDKFQPDRGTGVAKTLFGYGAFNLLNMQHTLNFGALKAVDDMRAAELPGRAAEDRISNIRMSLIGVQDNVARIGVLVSNAAGETSREITEIA